MTESVVATYPEAWEAELARHSLEDAGIPAWIEGTDDPARGGVRLVVPEEWAEDALLALAGELPEDGEELSSTRRPLWVAVVAVIVFVGMAIAAIPRVLWIPLLLISVIGLILWQLVRPAPSEDR